MKRSVIVLVMISCCFLTVVKGQNSADKKSGKLVVAACHFPVFADISENCCDAGKQFRENAINGILNSGETVKDPHSENRIEIFKQ